MASSGQRHAIAGLDLPLKLAHGFLGRLQRRGEGRCGCGIELALEASRGYTDRVEPARRGELGWLPEHLTETLGGLLCQLDPVRRLGRAQLPESRDEIVQVSTAGRVGGHLTERSDGHGLAELGPARNGRSVDSHCEPAPPAGAVVEGAQVHALPGSGLGGYHPRHLAARGVGPRETGDPLELGREAHAARIRRVSSRTAHARELFAPLGPSYDRVGATLSFGQDPRWRRFLVSRIPPDGGHVLDVATGTGLVAAELLRRGFRVTGLDQSAEMLAVARRRLENTVELVEAAAESMPFADESFDHLTFTYLLRYVDDPGATLAELARVVRPGGIVASLEFGVPRRLARPPWELYVRLALPLAGRILRDGWDEVGSFLGGSIRGFWARHPLERQLELWRAAGVHQLNVRRLSLGGGVVIWGRKQ